MKVEEIIQSAIQRSTQKNLTYRGELYPHEAYFLMQNENSYLVDIRTKEELNLVGLIPNAYWIEWTSYFSGEINPEFINNIDNKFLRNDSILLICRSGSRSHDAADFLQKNGFNNVYNVIDGFEGKKK
jgi:rhodanese-related sulfurtransferase